MARAKTSGKKGDTVFSRAGTHLPENIGSGPIEVILVELKSGHENNHA